MTYLPLLSYPSNMASAISSFNLSIETHHETAPPDCSDDHCGLVMFVYIMMQNAITDDDTDDNVMMIVVRRRRVVKKTSSVQAVPRDASEFQLRV